GMRGRASGALIGFHRGAIVPQGWMLCTSACARDVSHRGRLACLLSCFSGRTVMRIDIGKRSITDLVARQLDSLFFLEEGDQDLLARVMPDVLLRVERCFAQASNKYYRRDGEVYFSPWHSGQYTIFLYFLANTLFVADRNAHRALADKLYYLTRALNGLDLYYEVEMPDIFFLDHPLGSVIGRGVFGNFFTFSQQCT